LLLPSYWLLAPSSLIFPVALLFFVESLLLAQPLSPYSAVEFVVPLPLLAVGLAADLLCAAFQPLSGVDPLLERTSAVPLSFEQHQPLAVGLAYLLPLDWLLPYLFLRQDREL